jgi:hypothetical protein
MSTFLAPKSSILGGLKQETSFFGFGQDESAVFHSSIPIYTVFEALKTNLKIIFLCFG